MCAYYDDNQIIKKGDCATFQNQNITILTAKHIKENRTMDITYKIGSSEQMINIPYKTSGYGLNLSSRKLS